MAEKLHDNSPDVFRGQEWLFKAIKTLRPMVIVALAMLGGEAEAGKPLEELLHPHRQGFLDKTLVVPHPRFPDAAQSNETMDCKEKETMEMGMANVVEHFLNPSFRQHLRDNDLEDQLEALKDAIRFFDEMSFREKKRKITITKRATSKNNDIDDDLEIVIQNGWILSINGQEMDVEEFDKWRKVTAKIQRLGEELDRMDANPMSYRASDKLINYGDEFSFHLYEYLLEYFELIKDRLPQKVKDYLEDSKHNEFVQLSEDSEEGDMKFITMPFFDGDDKDVVIEMWLDSENEDFKTLISFTPNGRILITEDYGLTYKLLGPEDLFSSIYDQKSGDAPVPTDIPDETEDEEEPELEENEEESALDEIDEDDDSILDLPDDDPA